MIELSFLADIIVGIAIAATPLAYAALGELVVERAGVLNLGVEGMMILGAICGFIAGIETGSPLIGLTAAMLAGAGLAMLFGVLTQYLMSNQVATGLALTMFGLGVSALLGQAYAGQTLPSFPRVFIPGLSQMPVVGPLVSMDGLVYGSVVLTYVINAVLNRTRTGLVLRAVGEDHDAAHALGYDVRGVRMLALAFGGAMAGLGGAYLSMVQTPLWAEGMTAGRGWIALALVVFAAWRPWRALLGAYVFGGLTILGLHAQASGLKIDAQWIAMLPYLATILVLVLISRDSRRLKLNAPAALGKPFYKTA